MPRIPAPIRRFVLPAGCAALALLANVRAAAPDAPGARLDRPMPPDSTWTRVPGGAGTGCARGTPYAFFTHRGDPGRLLVYLEGGGACWSGVTCDPRRKQGLYDPAVDASDDPGARRNAGGIFDLTNPENPFRTFTIVVVSYCTADVHLGRRVVDYAIPAHDSLPPDSVRIAHLGYDDAMAALRWVYGNVPRPRLIVVAGGSAGAIASPWYAALVAEHYPRARVVQLGDAAGGYRGATLPAVMATWGATALLKGFPEFAGLDSAAFDFVHLYLAAARRPNLTLAQYNAAEDETQLLFLQVTDRSITRLAPLLARNLAEIRAAVPGFRAYTAPGTLHTILTRPEFYSLAVNGVRVRDWVADRVAGKPVPDVTCAGCLPALGEPQGASVRPRNEAAGGRRHATRPRRLAAAPALR